MTTLSSSVPVTFLLPNTVLRTSTFNASISVVSNLSVFSFVRDATVLPPQALTSSESSLFSFLTPSSLIYPSDLKAALSAVLASLGIGVPSGALHIAPPTFGLPAVTYAAFTFAAICIPPNSYNK